MIIKLNIVFQYFRYFLSTFFFISFSVILVTCSNHHNDNVNDGLSELYISAQKNLYEENFQDAIPILEKLIHCYPVGSYFHQMQLDLIYAHYKNFDLNASKKIIDRFKRLYPLHPNIDYVIYMEGIINMSFDRDVVKNFVGIDFNDRDPVYANNAFQIFSDLVKNYKESYYIPDTIKRLIYLKNRLSKHELSIAKFYFARKAYIAVINRINNMIKNYPETQATLIALPIMEQAYKKLKLNIEAEKTSKIISMNRK